MAKTLPQIKVLGSARLPGSGVRVAGNPGSAPRADPGPVRALPQPPAARSRVPGAGVLRRWGCRGQRGDPRRRQFDAVVAGSELPEVTSVSRGYDFSPPWVTAANSASIAGPEHRPWSLAAWRALPGRVSRVGVRNSRSSKYVFILCFLSSMAQSALVSASVFTESDVRMVRSSSRPDSGHSGSRIPRNGLPRESGQSTASCRGPQKPVRGSGRPWSPRSGRGGCVREGRNRVGHSEGQFRGSGLLIWAPK